MKIQSISTTTLTEPVLKPRQPSQRITKSPSLQPVIQAARPVIKKQKVAWDVTIVLFLSELVRYSAAWVEYVANFVKAKYPLLRKLIGTHFLGFVSSSTLRLRVTACDICPSKFKHKDGGDYCKNDNCGCGCWKGSRITYKRRLSGFQCPRGKFGYGWFGRLWYGVKSNAEKVE